MEIHTVKDLSKLIKQKRMALKMTQADASALCNVGIRFLSELENGKQHYKFYLQTNSS